MTPIDSSRLNSASKIGSIAAIGTVASTFITVSVGIGKTDGAMISGSAAKTAATPGASHILYFLFIAFKFLFLTFIYFITPMLKSQVE